MRLTRLGLFPEFRGRHLGKWFLGLAVEAAWDFRPERVWTSVSDADDPRAILLYQWAGFIPYETTEGEGAGALVVFAVVRGRPGDGEGGAGTARVAMAPAVGPEDHHPSAVAAHEKQHGGANRRAGGGPEGFRGGVVASGSSLARSAPGVGSFEGTHSSPGPPPSASTSTSEADRLLPPARSWRRCR